MQKKTFLVTNRSEGSITLVGRSRIEIPGNCKEFPVSLSAERAQAIVSRLKRYPLLKISEVPAQPIASGEEKKSAAAQAGQGQNVPTQDKAATPEQGEGEQERQAQAQQDKAATPEQGEGEQERQAQAQQDKAATPEQGSARKR